MPKLLAALLSGDAIPEADLQQANRERRGLIALIPPSEPVKDYSHLRGPPGGYRFPDFLKVGILASIGCAAVIVTIGYGIQLALGL